jgi:hypothetical protein
VIKKNSHKIIIGKCYIHEPRIFVTVAIFSVNAIEFFFEINIDEDISGCCIGSNHKVLTSPAFNGSWPRYSIWEIALADEMRGLPDFTGTEQ